MGSAATALGLKAQTPSARLPPPVAVITASEAREQRACVFAAGCGGRMLEGFFFCLNDPHPQYLGFMYPGNEWMRDQRKPRPCGDGRSPHPFHR